jgi:hypothetical protein
MCDKDSGVGWAKQMITGRSESRGMVRQEIVFGACRLHTKFRSFSTLIFQHLNAMARLKSSRL